MGLHFGVTAEAVQAMTVAQVLEAHADLSAKFKSKFKLRDSGVAATVEKQQPVQQAASVDPLFAARVTRQN
jgi:hypothetical protein